MREEKRKTARDGIGEGFQISIPWPGRVRKNGLENASEPEETSKSSQYSEKEIKESSPPTVTPIIELAAALIAPREKSRKFSPLKGTKVISNTNEIACLCAETKIPGESAAISVRVGRQN
jgi:hypothetical protein